MLLRWGWPHDAPCRASWPGEFNYSSLPGYTDWRRNDHTAKYLTNLPYLNSGSSCWETRNFNDNIYLGQAPSSPIESLQREAEGENWGRKKKEFWQSFEHCDPVILFTWRHVAIQIWYTLYVGLNGVLKCFLIPAVQPLFRLQASDRPKAIYFSRLVSVCPLWGICKLLRPILTSFHSHILAGSRCKQTLPYST